jgi:methyl-accepting chemotaxis protein
MASEPTDEPVTVSLPPELAAWLDEQATDRGTDRETILAQLLAAYRATDDLDADDPEALADVVDVESAVEAVLADRLPDIVDAVTDQLEVEPEVQEAVERHLQDALDDRLGAVEDDYMDKIQDVRQRVVQVKQEADAKAPADHEHPDLTDRIDGLATDVEAVEDQVETLRIQLDERTDETATRVDDLTETVDGLEEKVRTVAHVIRDLRDDSRVGSKRAASVKGIKRAAAELDVDRAKCSVCGNGVQVGLLTDPECPHCEAVVTDVEAKNGFFGSPKLVKAQSIEAPEDEDG